MFHLLYHFIRSEGILPHQTVISHVLATAAINLLCPNITSLAGGTKGENNPGTAWSVTPHFPFQPIIIQLVKPFPLTRVNK